MITKVLYAVVGVGLLPVVAVGFFVGCVYRAFQTGFRGF